jgi:hypothetical protein
MSKDDKNFLNKTILHSPIPYELPKILHTDKKYYYYLDFKYNLKTQKYEPNDNQHNWIIMLDFNNNELYSKIYQHACHINCIHLFDPLTILIDKFEDEILKLLNDKQLFIYNFISSKYNDISILKIKKFIICMWFNNIISLFDIKLINFDILDKYYKKIG